MLGKVKVLMRKINVKVVVLTLTLAHIIVAGVAIRLGPVRWGYYLTEFDPYFQYYITKLLVESGWKGYFEWFIPGKNVFYKPIKLFWYPYGRKIAETSFPGVAFAGSAIYHIAKGLGSKLSLFEICVIVPAILSIVTILALFILGYEIEGTICGLLSALLLALNTAYISRSIAGFYDDESVALPALALFTALFIASLRREGKRGIILTVLASLSLSYALISWGASLFFLNIVTFALIITAIFNKLDMQSAVKYLIVLLLSIITVIILPKYGPAKLKSSSMYLPLFALLLTPVFILAFKNIIKRKVLKYIRILLAVLIVTIFILLAFGLVKGVSGRYLSVLKPTIRRKLPLVMSVGEHRYSTWQQLFMEFNLVLPLSIFGALVMFSEMFNKEGILLLTIYALTFYTASSMVRLTLLLSPFACFMAAYGLTKLIRICIARLKGRHRVGLAGLVLFIMFIFILLPLIYSGPRIHAEMPALILTSSISPGRPPYRYNLVDWISALEWIKANVPATAVIACWWDYGYWISVTTNRSTLCDNGTLNSTQIKMVAKAFLSDELTAYKIFKKYNVSYVVVFEPYTTIGYISMPDIGLQGDFAKSSWMARIAGLNDRKYLRSVILKVEYRGRASYYSILIPADTPEARNATLYRMLFNPNVGRLFIFSMTRSQLEMLKRYGVGLELLYYVNGSFKPVNYTVSYRPLHYFKLVYKSKPHGYVLVYKLVEERKGE